MKTIIKKDKHLEHNAKAYVFTCEHCGSKILVHESEIHEETSPLAPTIEHFKCSNCRAENTINSLFGRLVGRIRYKKYLRDGLLTELQRNN